MARPLVVEIVGDARSLNRALGSAENTTSGFGKKIGSLGKTALGVAGAAGIGALIYSVKTGIGEFAQAQKVTAQTNAVIKSTGNVAHVSTEGIKDLAGSLMRKSGIDDEAIQSGENLLLTFTNIHNELGKGNDIFDQATKATLDLSVAFGKDMNQSAILVGKALNDPIKGLTALRRIGVQFTAGQQEQIKALVASGHQMQAQKLILAELRRETGGSAEALGKTLPGMINIARETFNNWAGDLVGKMIPALTNMGAWLRTNWPAISASIKQNWEQQIKPTLEAFITIITVTAETVRRHWGTIGPLVMAAAQAVKAAIGIATAPLRSIAALLRGDWSGAWKVWKNALSAQVEAAKSLLLAGAGVIKTIGARLGAELKNAVVAGVSGIGSAVWNQVNNIGSVIGQKAGAIAGWGMDVARGLVSGIVSGLSGLGSKLVSLIKTPINALIDRINSALTFHVSVNTHVPGVGKVSFGYTSNIPHLAVGGPIGMGQAAIVGERGPELFVPSRAGTVVPNGVGRGVVILELDGREFARAVDRKSVV